MKNSMTDECPELDMADYLKKRQEDGKPLIVIDPMGDSQLLRKTNEIKSIMTVSDNTMQWTGSNCIEVSNFLGHEDFHHKDGYLLIDEKENMIAIPKGHFFGKDESDNLVIFIDPHGEHDFLQDESTELIEFTLKDKLISTFIPLFISSLLYLNDKVDIHQGIAVWGLGMALLSGHFYSKYSKCDQEKVT